jgi:hypothetical protein
MTTKQQVALENMVENGGNVSRAMLNAGYSPNTAKTPQKLTGSKGFLALCEEKGLTDDLLVQALVEDIRDKKGNRKAEIELGFKIKGRLLQKPKDEPIIGNEIIFTSFSEKEKEALNKLLEQ